MILVRGIIDCEINMILYMIVKVYGLDHLKGRQGQAHKSTIDMDILGMQSIE